jgi:hypothetical protein
LPHEPKVGAEYARQAAGELGQGRKRASFKRKSDLSPIDLNILFIGKFLLYIDASLVSYESTRRVESRMIRQREPHHVNSRRVDRVFVVLFLVYAFVSACLFLASWTLKVVVYIFDELRFVV